MEYVTALIILTNTARTTPLHSDAFLTAIASVRAEQVCTDFSHRGFNLFSQFIPGYSGENLAKDFDTPEETHSALMASPTHKDNIVNPRYNRIGVAKAKSCNAYAFIFSN